MTKEVRIDNTEEEENFDYNSFKPDEMLSNKQSSYSTKSDYSTIPDEDFLTNNTLWPEADKLFGHGYEVISVAVSNNGKYIASGGKAQSEKHSKLFLWSVEKSSLIAKLDGHVLTIVQIEFSRDDEYILSVSRDRSVCLYQKCGGDIPYKLVQVERETHGRIIWGCSWASDCKLFITGSRDRFVKVWVKNTDSNNSKKHFEDIISHEFDHAVTSVNIIPCDNYENKYNAIIGLESGEIQMFKIDLNSRKISKVYSVHKYLAHGGSVKRIKSFVKYGDDNKDCVVCFATCSDDFSTRIFEVKKEVFTV